MQIEQAIFTSGQSDTAAGYHLLASSPEITAEDAQMLAVWGPSHDSLNQPADLLPTSSNFFPLPSGAHCVSFTQLAGGEYSGRGLRTYTTMLVVPEEVLTRFANNAFALLRAARAKGMLQVFEQPPAALRSFQLVGRSRAVDEGLLLQAVDEFGAPLLATAIQAIQEQRPLILVGAQRPDALMAGLLNCLPVSFRASISFSTGLAISQRRPFQVQWMPTMSAEIRRLQRTEQYEVVDLSECIAEQQDNSADETAPSHSERVAAVALGISATNAHNFEGWARNVFEHAKRGHLHTLAEIIERQLLPDPALDLLTWNRAVPTQALTREPASAVAPPNFLQRHENTDLMNSHQEPDEVESELNRDEIEFLLQDAEPTAFDEFPTGRTAKPGRKHPYHLGTGCTLDETPEAIEQLERLDDAVYDALHGDAAALASVADLWKQLIAGRDTGRIEQAREQYLRYALNVWERRLSDGQAAGGSVNPETAIAALQVLCVLFGDR
ncbi:MAG: hypothetical protein SGJ20_20680 [Planctomycetota bacterium]|nr:hypothetical protein [Planctomycetota bacterium]